MRKYIYQFSVALFAVAALVFGRLVNWPDAVHTKHGLPLTWGVHQLSTIAGPVDTWSVNLVNLSIDLVFWVALILLVPVVIERTSKSTG